MTAYTTIDSPLGELLLVGDGGALRGLYLQQRRLPVGPPPEWRREPDAFAAVSGQLGEYFAGERTSFDLSLALTGTPFQLRVWEALGEVGYGETLSYGELARRIGRPSAARAVGAANGANPISIVIPCHRLVGAGGAMTGYSGGVESKRLLLDLETSAASSICSG
ncbi:MAG: methylated-DNA--[protein]-cysteine S-methyltransferase [Thermoleophilia bacterium]|nr:methylated-DNA--[protein]-cysteine S-methyltransferase [Thermoleophilia bacterium]